ncbi:Ig-like domain-containing protein [Bacillus sp. JJ1764]|uniref:Ig-like domain-containing protein n=1 Tax=Bacillus sp. JJ1764 TaxID=3122964 RepID=UPI002FFE7B28
MIKKKTKKLLLFASFFTTLAVFGQHKALASNVALLPTGYIDLPTQSATIKDDMIVKGWFLDGNGVAKIDVLVDGKIIGQAQYGLSRPDVARVYPQYNNQNSGYNLVLSSKTLTNGPHTVTVRETGKTGATKTLDSTKVNVQNAIAAAVRGCMDFPANAATINGDMTVSGWFLDTSGVSKIDVLVDGKSVGQAQYGLSRPDVARVFPSFNNTNSGYKLTFNTSSLSNGQHTVTVKETGKNGVITTLSSAKVNVQNTIARGWMDTPSNNDSIKGKMDVSGWFLDASGVSKVEVLVDGKNMGQAQYGLSRPDVAKVFPSYKNGNSGYKLSIDTSGLTAGQHTVTVRETGKNGSTTTLNSVKVNVQNPEPKGSLDVPSNGATIKGDMVVSGWFLDVSGVYKIEVLIDGKSVDEAQYGLPRADVYKAFPTYNNTNAGYKLLFNTRSLANGQHTVTVKETGQNGVSNTLNSVKVNVQNPPAIGSIDSPLNGSMVKGDMVVSGWFLDLSGVSTIEILMDGKSIGTATYGSDRPDVLNAYPDFQNSNSGYKLTVNSLMFSEGQHTITVKETGKNGSITTINNTIFVSNGNPYLQIDLRKPSNITAADIIDFFNKKNHADSPLKDYAQYFIDAQSKYGVNAQYLVAHAIWETGWGGSNLKNYKHNLFGYGAYDSCPFTCGYYFPTAGDSINYEAFVVRRDYLNSTGSYYNGPTLTGMNVRYATDQNWANGIANLMLGLKPFDAAQYFKSDVMGASSTDPPLFGRDIPAGKPYPSDIIINNTVDTYATVNPGGVTLRSLPYVSTSTTLKSLAAGTDVKVLGYNTDVLYYQGDATKYPYDYRWYRVLANGQQGWVYGGALTFK